MGKLYIFGIGGTGSRVLKALTMLMAAGVKIDADEIVPIIIDPDVANSDLERTVKLMRDYNKVYNKITHSGDSQNGFFRTNINMSILPNVILPLDNTSDCSFKEYIAQPQMKDAEGRHNANFALTSMLFSEKNLNSTMRVGFKGNPNIGSVVLNQIAQSTEFKNIVNSFDQGDRIFIISSIFGGTGASGFPLLLKNIKAIKDDVTGGNLIKNAVIGAISVLPYFDVAPDPEEKSEIDSSTFISKTKAALLYYERNMSEVNALYYIGDKISKQYTNSEGGNTQKNDAHFVELAAALAIFDFAQTVNDSTPPTVYKEFGIKNDTQEIIFSDLYDITNSIIKKPLAQFTLLCRYLNEQMHKAYANKQSWAVQHTFDNKFTSSQAFNSGLAEFKKTFLEWLTEMAENKRAFSPFNLAGTDIFGLIKGVTPAYKFLEKKSYALFDDTLNSLKDNVTDDQTKELQSFLELFYLATEKLCASKLNIL